MGDSFINRFPETFFLGIQAEQTFENYLQLVSKKPKSEKSQSSCLFNGTKPILSLKSSAQPRRNTEISYLNKILPNFDDDSEIQQLALVSILFWYVSTTNKLFFVGLDTPNTKNQGIPLISKTYNRYHLIKHSHIFYSLKKAKI